MIHIFDGAMGTMLQAGGLKPGAAPELMNVEAPEVVKGVHLAYLRAGSDYIETNTFGASPLKLAHYGLTDRMAELNRAAVEVARAAIMNPYDEKMQEALSAAMTDIGEDFGAGRMFLPQVLLSAETMREAFNHLQAAAPETETVKKGTVVLATVKGDYERSAKLRIHERYTLERWCDTHGQTGKK